MTIVEANKFLKNYNKWRRGAEIPQPHPKETGIAIETITKYIDKKLNENKTIK